MKIFLIFKYLIPNQVSAIPHSHQSAKYHYYNKSWRGSIYSTFIHIEYLPFTQKFTTGIIYQQIYKLRFICHIIKLF